MMVIGHVPRRRWASALLVLAAASLNAQDKRSPHDAQPERPTVATHAGTAGRGTGSGTPDASMIAISSHPFGPVALDLNAGFTHRSGNGSVAPTSSSVWTVSTGFPLGCGVGWSAEVFGYPGTSGVAGAP